MIKKIENIRLPSDIEFDKSLSYVVKRIKHVLPPDLIIEFFSSNPNETGGISVFPYYRVDSKLAALKFSLSILENKKINRKLLLKKYREAAKIVFKIVIWVEIGFKGLNNLARSPASTNWTSLIGHDLNNKSRARKIKRIGKIEYQQVISRFFRFRTEKKIKDDIFSQYNLEYLLEKFR